MKNGHRRMAAYGEREHGGRISKLAIKINDGYTCNYDRGWDQKPEDSDTEKVLAVLIKEYH